MGFHNALEPQRCARCEQLGGFCRAEEELNRVTTAHPPRRLARLAVGALACAAGVAAGGVAAADPLLADGAYFSALTMVRLRDRFGGPPPYLGVDLCYGAYDLSGTPSTILLRGKVPYATATGDNTNRRHYLGDRSGDDVRDPAISPMYADLHDLPPMLVTVGTSDWLLDDSLGSPGNSFGGRHVSVYNTESIFPAAGRVPLESADGDRSGPGQSPSDHQV